MFYDIEHCESHIEAIEELLECARAALSEGDFTAYMEIFQKIAERANEVQEDGELDM